MNNSNILWIHKMIELFIKYWNLSKVASPTTTIFKLIGPCEILSHGQKSSKIYFWLDGVSYKHPWTSLQDATYYLSQSCKNLKSWNTWFVIWTSNDLYLAQSYLIHLLITIKTNELPLIKGLRMKLCNCNFETYALLHGDVILM